MKRLSNTVAAKMDDPEEDADSELEEEQDIRKYKPYFNCENVFLVISMIQAKTWAFAQYFCFHVIYWYFTQDNEFFGNLSKEYVIVNVQNKAYYTKRPS